MGPLAVIANCKDADFSAGDFKITEGPQLPRGRGGHAVGIVDGCVVVAGGSDWSKDRTTKCWLDDSVIYKDNKWIAGPNLPFAQSYSMFAHDETGLYIAGGRDASKKYSRAYRLATLHGPWQQITPLPTAASDGAGAILEKKFYVLAGYTPAGLSGQFWSLDISEPNAAWQRCANPPGPAQVMDSSERL